MKKQVESLQREISNTTEFQTDVTQKCHGLEKENLVLKNRAEEAEHQGRLEVTNIRMEMLKERGELERQRDRLANETAGEHIML